MTAHSVTEASPFPGALREAGLSRVEAPPVVQRLDAADVRDGSTTFFLAIIIACSVEPHHAASGPAAEWSAHVNG